MSGIPIHAACALENNSPPSRGINTALPSGASIAAHVCYQHSTVLAVAICACGRPVCSVCLFKGPLDSDICPECAILLTLARKNKPETRPATGLPGNFCGNHPEVAAVAACASCGRNICATCDFVLQSNKHLCPVCATKSELELTPVRRVMLTSSLLLAAVATFFLIVLQGDLLDAVSSTKEVESLGALVALLFTLCAFASLGMALMVRRKGQNSPTLHWVSLIWSGVLTALATLTILIGLFVL